MTTLSLEALRKQIAQQESQLQVLRKELEARQARLASLTNRKKGLQTQLQQVENEITALARGARTATTGTPREQPTLRELVTHILRKSRTPMTRGELAVEAIKAGHRTSSKNLANVIGTEIKKRSHIEHVAGEGYRLKKGKG